MKSSIENQSRKARSNAVEDFKLRFMQKWYNTTPSFHWKELNLSQEVKELVISEKPSICLFYFDDTLELDDKRWEEKDLHRVLTFDWINEVLPTIEKDEQTTWLKNNILTAMEVFNIDQDDLILCYHEGTAPFAIEWRTHFEKQFKV